MSTTSMTVPYRIIRNNQGTVTIEKHFSDASPNCGIAIFILIIAIILPASLAGVAPLASILLLIGSTFFPGIPLFLVNKKWKIDIDNVSRHLKITRWHDFNKVKKQEEFIRFDEIREIVAETSLDGTKRRLVAILLTGARHVLYETMNMNHADRFKTDFMAAIQLQTLQAVNTSPHVPSNQQASPIVQIAPRTPGPANSVVVVPSLRQFSIPDPNTGSISDVSQQNPSPAPTINGAPGANDDVDDLGDVDDVTDSRYVDSTTDANDDNSNSGSPTTGAPGNQEIGTATQEDDAAVHQRLVEIAHRKREILSRVFIPGPEPEMVPSDPVSPVTGTPAGEAAACSPLRNREDWYNEFDDCHGIGYLFSPELGGRRPAATSLASSSIEVRAGRAPKKKAGEDEDEEEIIKHSIDRKTEKELGVQKIRSTCMVCTIPLKGTTFICPTCETKYCIRCARTLASRKEYCWTCRKPLKVP